MVKLALATINLLAKLSGLGKLYLDPDVKGKRILLKSIMYNKKALLQAEKAFDVVYDNLDLFDPKAKRKIRYRMEKFEEYVIKG